MKHQIFPRSSQRCHFIALYFNLQLMILNYLSTVFSVLAALVSPLNPSTKPSIFAEDSVSSTMFFTPVVYFSVGIRSLKSLLTAFLNRVSIFGFCKVKATILFSYISVLANRTMNRLPNSGISALFLLLKFSRCR